MHADSPLDELELLANAFLEAGTRYHEAVAACSDVAALRELASRHTPHGEVSEPALRRVIELAPADASACAAMGWVLWLSGEDEAARRFAGRSAEIEPENVDALLLFATLAPESAVQLALYYRVLSLCPGHEIAAAHVAELERKRRGPAA